MDQLHPEEVLDILGQRPPIPPEPAGTEPAEGPPTTGEAFSALAATGPESVLDRSMARGEYSDASDRDQFVNRLIKWTTPSAFLPNMPPEGRMLDPADANAAYAPKGQDWFSKPISEGLAQTLAKQKLEKLQQDSDIARYEQVHSWPVNFGVGIAASMLDPINAGASFVPGIGGEAVAARLGGGVAARLAGRAVSGAIGAEAATIPSVAIHGALDDDYTLREAFFDLAMGAAAGAVIQGGIEGGLREGWRATLGRTAEQANTAMRVAVADVAQGNPVGVTEITRPPPEVDDMLRHVGFTDSELASLTPEQKQNALDAVRVGKIGPQDLSQIAAEQKRLNEAGGAMNISAADFLEAKEAVNAATEPDPKRFKPAVSGEAGPAAGGPGIGGEAGTAAPGAEGVVGRGAESGGVPAVHPLLAEADADPKIQEAIAHPQINRANDVAYGAGASAGDSMVTNVDHHIPEQPVVINNVPVDLAVGANIHEQYEKFAMEKLIAGGMPKEQAYITAHHLIAEVAERRWVESLRGPNGERVSWDAYQHEWNKILPQIQHENLANPAPNLYDKPYPHDDIELAKHEPTGPVPEPTAAEKAAVEGAAPKATSAPSPFATDPDVAEAQRALADAQARQSAYDQAAQCLVEAGV